MRASTANLPDDCRARCERCRGRGSHADPAALAGCQSCHDQGMACALHVCRMCGGSGLVCPACCGTRWVRTREWDTSCEGGIAPIDHCDRCWDTTNNRVDPVRERRVIDKYLARFRYTQGQPASAPRTEMPASPAIATPDKLDAALRDAQRARRNISAVESTPSDDDLNGRIRTPQPNLGG